MGSKITNAQAGSAFGPSTQYAMGNIAQAFGGGTEEEARKRKEQEDAQAAGQAQMQQQVQGQEPSAWDTMKSMASDAVGGVGSVASNPGSAWDTMTNTDGTPQKKKKQQD